MSNVLRPLGAALAAALLATAPSAQPRLLSPVFVGAGGATQNDDHHLTLTLGEPASGAAASADVRLRLGGALRLPVAGGSTPLDAAPLPDALALQPPAPNPASGPVLLRYGVPEAGPVRLTVVDALGREVALLADGPTPAGTHAAHLGVGGLAPGVYVVRLQGGAEAVARTLTVVR